MKNVLIFTSLYPYGTGETYLEAEIEYLCGVSNVTVVPLGVKNSDDEHRELPPSAKLVILEQNKKSQKIKAFIKSIFSVAFAYGVFELIKCKKISVKTIKELLKFIYAGESHYQKVIFMLKHNKVPLNKDLIAYSYWMDGSAYLVSKLGKKGCISLSRAHGGDLYDERTPWNHQFLRKYIVEHIDYLCPISFKGKEYLENRIGKYENIIPMHLGIKDEGICEAYESDKIILVSCSAAIKLKRIELIIEALSKIDKENINWVHFGDGPELDSLKAKAEEKLKSVKYEFKGQVQNSALKSFYKNNSVKAFINASDTEGVPVSIMEAMSFGIPTVATDVGGVGELVKDGVNGFLVSPDSSESLREGILKILNMSDIEYESIRYGARNTFLSDWEYRNNYEKFYNLISCNK